MVAKGTIKSDHYPINKFEMLVIGSPVPLTLITVGALEEELQTVELPDRTVASGGNSMAVEFEVTMPAHHTAEQAFMELWYVEARTGLPTYKKPATLILTSLSGEGLRTYTLNGLFPKGRNTPELDMTNEGEDARVTWVMSADEVLPA